MSHPNQYAPFRTAIKPTILSFLLFQSCMAHAQIPDSLIRNNTQIQQERDRIKAIEAQQPKAPDIRLDGTDAKPSAAPRSSTLPIDESPRFLIQHIELVGDSAQKFQFALSQALHQTGLMAIQSQTGQTLIVTQAHHQAAGHPDKETIGVPLGAQGINILMEAAQNAIIDRGYTTTRILAESQDLTSGTLKLTIIPGRVRHIRFDTSNAEQTHVNRAHSFNAIPIQEGDILNLRDIEQGLENLKRISTVEADIKIAPAEAPNQSDLIITWSQRAIPFRVNFALDNSGSKSTGEYQGNSTFSWDNPLTLNDLFYFSAGRGLFGYERIDTRDDNGNPNGRDHGNSRNWNLHYSIPYGYWQAEFNASAYQYEQAVAGDSQTYTYSGNSRTQDLKLSRLIYRDAHRKSTAYIKGWSRYSDNYIDDTEIEVQRRKTAGLEFGLTHKEYIGPATLDLGLSYKRGTGANNALRAPEEIFGEGTSRMKIITADAALNLPFKISAHNFNFNTSLHAQWNKTRLLQQDKIAIGGRYTVRGFDGELSLAAERGWYNRNELAWAFIPNHQTYIAVDAGHVSGPSSEFLLGQTLIGGAFGIRGQLKAGGVLNYDAFVGTPFKKPRGFQTAKVTFGFNLGYSF